MPKLRIVQALWTLGRGGAERMVLDLSRDLRSRGHNVSLLAAGGGGPMEADFADAGIPVTVAPSIGRLGLVKFLTAALREIEPDVLHTHLGGDIWGGLAANRLKIHPWILTAHSHEPDTPFLQRLGRRRAYRRVDHVACVSQSVREAIKKIYRVPDEKLSVIRVGLDFSRFSPREAALASDTPRLIVVGRLVPEKGHAALLKALARVKRPWTLELAGDGPERLALQHLALTLGILPRVRFAGVVSDVADKLANADLFLMPSRHEGQGLALFEAAACRLPAVVSDLASLRESFGDGAKRSPAELRDDAVRFVSVGDVEAWGRAINESLDNYADALKRAERARSIVLSEFTVGRMTDKYLELYEDLARQ